MSRSITRTSLLVALSGLFSLAQNPPSGNELALKLEERAEKATDYQILAAALQNNQREKQVVQAFCSVRLAEPARSARIAYCAAKYKLFDNRATDLAAQAEQLRGAIQKMDQEIAALRSKRAK